MAEKEETKQAGNVDSSTVTDVMILQAISSGNVNETLSTAMILKYVNIDQKHLDQARKLAKDSAMDKLMIGAMNKR